RDHELLVTIDPGLAGYKDTQSQEVVRQITERVGGIAGVRSVVASQSRLMSGNLQLTGLIVPGYTAQKGEDLSTLWVVSHEVGPRFFEISGMRLKSGRDFTEHDNGSAGRVVVINETMARHFFGDRDPMGRQIVFDRKDTPSTIVGVVRDFKNFGLQEGKQDVV